MKISLIKRYERLVLDDDLLYLIGYALVLFNSWIYSTNFCDHIPNMLKLLIRLAGYSFLTIHYILRKKYNVRLFFVSMSMISLFFLSLYKSSYSVLLDYALCCAFAVDIDFSKIVKLYVKESVVITFVTISAACLGLIETYTYYRKDTGYIRMSLGFIYPTNFAAHIFFIMCGIAYISYSKFNMKYVMGYSVIAYITFKLTNSRGPSAMIVFLAIIVYMYKRMEKKNKTLIPKVILKYSSIICAIVTLVIIHYYDKNNSAWEFVNKFTTNRLEFAKSIMMNNKITLFGQYIEQRGDGNGGRLAGEPYTYIDLSFQRILLMYGLVLFVFILIYSLLLNKKALKNNNAIISVLLFVISIYSLTAQHYFDFSYNFILLAYFANIPLKSNYNDNKSKLIQ